MGYWKYLGKRIRYELNEGYIQYCVKWLIIILALTSPSVVLKEITENEDWLFLMIPMVLIGSSIILSYEKYLINKEK